MTDEKAKAIVTAVYAGNQWEVMQELPESARCAEVDLIVGLLCEEIDKIQRAQSLLKFRHLEEIPLIEEKLNKK